jgi:hypothetical protein
VSLAQYGVESAWGRFEPANSNNGFGIQRLPGLPYVSALSHEFRGGRMISVVENFAKFDSVAEAFDKHAELIATNRAYAVCMTKKTAESFAISLTGIYATAPNYGAALVSLMRTENLEQYDVDTVPVISAFSAISQLQDDLNKLGTSPKLTVDGMYGQETRDAIRNFQSTHGLSPVDGDAGPITMAAIKNALTHFGS